jgi:ribonuclease HI
MSCACNPDCAIAATGRTANQQKRTRVRFMGGEYHGECVMTMKSSKSAFYAVRSGHKPGIYRSWEECRRHVDGYSNAEYKRFTSRGEAELYLNGSLTGSRRAKAADPVQMSLTRSQCDEVTLKEVTIYADGACIGNPGPGGYGVIIAYGERRKELSAGFRLTTNNRMEILGCIAGLSALKERCDVTVYSDSRYVVNTMTKSWAIRWRRNQWKRKDGDGEMKDALNKDLWIQMLELCDKHRVQFKWIRGHSGNEGNERCDELARTAASAGSLGIDTAYENPTR